VYAVDRVDLRFRHEEKIPNKFAGEFIESSAFPLLRDVVELHSLPLWIASEVGKYHLVPKPTREKYNHRRYTDVEESAQAKAQRKSQVHKYISQHPERSQRTP